MKGVRKVLELSKQAEEKKLNLVSGLCWRYDYGVKATIQKSKMEPLERSFRFKKII